MIRIHRPAQEPEVLRIVGVEATQKLVDLFSTDPRYGTGELVLGFRADIYAHPEVKSALIFTQYGKCCFCETRVGEDGDIEHFRPKGGVCDGVGAPMQRPGYYWLAYVWSNLFLCCSACNQRYKRNIFPLRDAQQRCQNAEAPLSAEDPLLINPAEQNPEDFISFRREVPYALDGNQIGSETISILRLDRQALMERRRDALMRARSLYEWLTVRSDSKQPEVHALVEKTRSFLTEIVSDAGEFAGMMRAAEQNNYYSSLQG